MAVTQGLNGQITQASYEGGTGDDIIIGSTIDSTGNIIAFCGQLAGGDAFPLFAGRSTPLGMIYVLRTSGTLIST